MAHRLGRGYFVFFTCFLVTVFLTAIWLVFWANGYRLLTHPLRFVKTGLITVRIEPDIDSRLLLNGQLMSHREFSNLPPGRYTIQVQRDSYFSWEKTLDLKGGEAAQLNDIVLFYQQPLRSPIEPGLIERYTKLLHDPTPFQTGLQVFDGEIWAEDVLVTRYSNTVRQALWLPGKKHILALVDQTLRVMDADGSNDHPLLTFAAGSQTIRFVPLLGGQRLILETDGRIEIVEITPPKSLLPSLPLDLNQVYN